MIGIDLIWINTKIDSNQRNRLELVKINKVWFMSTNLITINLNQQKFIAINFNQHNWFELIWVKKMIKIYLNQHNWLELIQTHHIDWNWLQSTKIDLNWIQHWLFWIESTQIWINTNLTKILLMGWCRTPDLLETETQF